MSLLLFEAPKGAALDFVVVFGVILFGPLVVQRARLPGIIGLLIGGYAIGPHGLGILGSGNQTIPELGQLGLLYLMFVAGLELDLGVLRDYRRAAVSFGLLTFAFPFLGGVAVGLSLGWSVPATLLLGSLLASHTLLLYPMIRDAGLAGNAAVASAVGATVLTDTLALVILAGVAGSETGSGSFWLTLGEIAFGLVVLLALAVWGLPRLAAAALRLWGGDRLARYLVAILSFLLMAMLAEVFGIEGIVGAFFAGMALNRLVPNEGPSMDRIEFFGAAVFIPIFVVSIGLLLDPSVMFTADTLGLAALLCAASIGGKAIASALADPVLGFTRAEAGLMFVLTTPQAAATLAATLIGFEIGLFGVSVVNAVLVLIVVSVVGATLLAPHAYRRVEPGARRESLGGHVLLATSLDEPSESGLRVAQLLARPDDGIVDVAIAQREGDERPERSARRALERRLYRGVMDGTLTVVAGRTVGEAIGSEVRRLRPSVVVVDLGETPTPPLDALPRSTPTIRLHGPLDRTIDHFSIVGSDAGVDDPLTIEVARRLARGEPLRIAGTSRAVEPGTLVVTAADTDVARGAGDGTLVAVVETPVDAPPNDD